LLIGGNGFRARIERIKHRKAVGMTDDTSPKLIRFGLYSVVFSVLAILSVFGEYEILRHYWFGNKGPILGIIFLLLPGTAIGLAVSGILLGKNAIFDIGRDRAFGIIGIVVSLLTLIFCCLLFGFYLVVMSSFSGL
jgi:hypothetical protein